MKLPVVRYSPVGAVFDTCEMNNPQTKCWRSKFRWKVS